MSGSHLERAGALAASAVVAVGLVVAGLLVPSAVDQVAQSDATGRAKVLVTSRHATEVRVGYLFLVAALLCVAPATRVLLSVAGRGQLLVAVGWRLAAVGASAGAVGNAFAPLVLPSTVGFDPAVMGPFAHHHETSGASWTIIAFYLLLPIGALVLLVGLLRNGAVPRWAAVATPVALGAITPLRLGVQAVVDGLVLGACLLWWNRHLRTR